MFEIASDYPAAILFGGVSGGIGAALFSLIEWFVTTRKTNAQYLLSEALRMQAMVEAWIVVGRGWETYELDHTRPLQATEYFSDDGPLALYPVEIRAILDELVWNSHEQQYYTFIKSRRTWIVRAKVVRRFSYGKDSPSSKGVLVRPAILSSRGVEELCGYIEQVVNAGPGFPWLLSRYSLKILEVILPAVAGQDRIEVLGSRLSDKAQRFLKKYRDKHPNLSILGEQKHEKSSA